MNQKKLIELAMFAANLDEGIYDNMPRLRQLIEEVVEEIQFLQDRVKQLEELSDYESIFTSK